MIKENNMKKKVIITLGLFILMNFGQSCNPEHFLIIDISFQAAMIKDNNYKDKQHIFYGCTSSIKDKLVFIITYHTEYLYGYTGGFGNVCYARTVGHIDDNKLLRETYSLSFDKPFSYNGNTIEQEVNIFEVESIVKEIDEYVNYKTFCNASANLVLDFSDVFFKNATFEFAEYVVTFSCKTSDDKFFIKSIVVTFEK